MFGRPAGVGVRKLAVSRAPSGSAATGDFQSAAAPERSAYGYVFDWSHTYAPRALNRILSKDIMARASMEGTVVRTTRGQVELGRGAIFVPFDRQEVSQGEIHAVMEEKLIHHFCRNLISLGMSLSLDRVPSCFTL